MSERTHSTTATHGKPSLTPVPTGVLQRKCACGTHTGGGDCAACAGEKQTLRRKAANNHDPTEVPPIVYDVLHSPGQPLDRKTRAFFEPRFGRDLSLVPAHAPGRGERPLKTSRRLPSLRDVVQQVEIGHTDCDWDRNVARGEGFKPRSGEPKSVVTNPDECTRTCTREHEDLHIRQLRPVCRAYFDCFQGAPRLAASSPACLQGKGAERERCTELETARIRSECFIATSDRWKDAVWECDAYKTSLACAQRLQQKSQDRCSGRIGTFIYSTQLQINRYCNGKGESPRGPRSSQTTPQQRSEPARELREIFQAPSHDCTPTERQALDVPAPPCCTLAMLREIWRLRAEAVPVVWNAFKKLFRPNDLREALWSNFRVRPDDLARVAVIRNQFGDMLDTITSEDVLFMCRDEGDPACSKRRAASENTRPRRVWFCGSYVFSTMGDKYLVGDDWLKTVIHEFAHAAAPNRILPAGKEFYGYPPNDPEVAVKNADSYALFALRVR